MFEAKKPNRIIGFANGMLLELYDFSRKVAGGRWRVGLLARIDIPVEEALLYLNGGDPECILAFKEACGATLRFEQKRERNIIAGEDKEQVLQNMLDFYLQGALSYLSHPDFIRKYVNRYAAQTRTIPGPIIGITVNSC